MTRNRLLHEEAFPPITSEKEVLSADLMETAKLVYSKAQTALAERPLVPLAEWLAAKGLGLGPYLLAAPHPDDISIALGGFVADMSSRGTIFYEVVFYSGTRSAGWPPGFAAEHRAKIRRLEVELETLWLGLGLNHPPIMLDLSSYNSSNYEANEDDFGKVIKTFAEINPALVMCPASDDRHPAHRACRALVAVGLLANDLDIPVVSYWTPWGPIAQANAFHPLSPEAAHRKALAIAAHVSQSLNANYVKYARSLADAYGSLLWQLEKGFHASRPDPHEYASPNGVELFRIEETLMPEFEDPIWAAKSLLRSKRKQL
jgi:LmbE family N-acetylglucosaminyl deacetylase